jgi:hypothetical protein
MTRNERVGAILKGAGGTVLSLFGGTLMGLLLGEAVFQILPGHQIEDPRPTSIILAAIPAIGGVLIGGAAWGVLMGRIARSSEKRRLALAGALGFAPITILLAFALLTTEASVSQALGPGFPVHRLFTIAFTSCASLIAGVSTWAIGRALRLPGGGPRLALSVAIASAVGFLGVNLTMEAAGWVVGAPRAAERATMLTVMFSGMLGAGLLAGGLLGRALGRLPSNSPNDHHPGTLAG